jgi:membrane protein DedA with SNARE-associated domain
MGRLIRNLKTFSGALVGLAVMLIALFFVLNWLAKRGWGPVSTAAAWTEQRASGQSYASAPPVVGVPSSSYGPAL